MKPFYKRFITAIRHENERQRWEETLVDKVNEVYSHVSDEGGLLTRLTNNTGAASIKGMVVAASTSVDNAFIAAPTAGYNAIGVVYDDGIANGSECRIVVTGVAEVLLEDSTSATRDNWVRVSDNVAGRADASGAVPSPPTADSHFKEIGHCLETVSAGTNKLCKIIVHFN